MLKAYEISNLFHLRIFPYPAPSEKPDFTANIPLKMGMLSFIFFERFLVLQKKPTCYNIICYKPKIRFQQLTTENFPC